MGEKDQGHSGTIMVVVTQDSCGHVRNAIPKQRSNKHKGIAHLGKKKSFTSVGSADTDHSLLGRTHCARSQLRFYLSAPHPNRWFWVHKLPYWLFSKSGTWGKGDLEAGRMRKFFRAIFIFIQLFQMRTPGNVNG
jgi:hypothetical protein